LALDGFSSKIEIKLYKMVKNLKLCSYT